MSPCPLIESMVNDDELALVADAFRDLRSEHSNLAPSFCVGSEFTRTEEGVTRLANTIIGLQPSSGIASVLSNICFHRLKTARYLEGLREIVRACALNDIAVLLPNSGWVGWLAMGWGAYAYSGGATQSSWYDRVPTPMNPPPRVDRIHDAPLMTRREFDLGPSLEAVDGYEPCNCISCEEMGGAFDARLAWIHQLRAARSESLAVEGLQQLDERRLRIRNRLVEADQLWRSLPTYLRQSIPGDHLGMWQGLA